MFSPPSPATSPLAHLGAKMSYRSEMFHPSQSSPLAGSSPTIALQTRRRREYKSQSSSRSVVPPSLSGGIEDTPQKQFLRGRFKARCLERVKENKERAIRKRRSSGSVDGSSSDGYDMDGDFSMDDDEEDNLDDELYRRVMNNEERKASHSKKVSFERDFGSSIDPNMHDDMETLEWELTGRASKINAPSPPSEDFDDVQILEYLAELEELEWEEAQEKAAFIATGVIDLNNEDPGDLEREFTRGSESQHPSPSRSMYGDFQMSSPPSSPSRPGLALPVPLQTSPKSTATWNCPFCSNSTMRTQIACEACMAQYPLEHAGAAWIDAESHPEGQQSDHVPLATSTPSESGIGVVMLCGAPGCDWCFAL